MAEISKITINGLDLSMNPEWATTESSSWGTNVTITGGYMAKIKTKSNSISLSEGTGTIINSSNGINIGPSVSLGNPSQGYLNLATGVATLGLSCGTATSVSLGSNGLVTIGGNINVLGDFFQNGSKITIGSGGSSSGGSINLNTAYLKLGTEYSTVLLDNNNTSITIGTQGTKVEIKGGDVSIGTVYPITVGDAKIKIGTTDIPVNLDFYKNTITIGSSWSQIVTDGASNKVTVKANTLELGDPTNPFTSDYIGGVGVFNGNINIGTKNSYLQVKEGSFKVNTIDSGGYSTGISVDSEGIKIGADTMTPVHPIYIGTSIAGGGTTLYLSGFKVYCDPNNYTMTISYTTSAGIEKSATIQLQ